MAVIKRKATAKKRLTPTQRGTWGGDRPATPRRKAPSGTKRQSLQKILGALEKLIKAHAAPSRRAPSRPSSALPPRRATARNGSGTRRRP